MQYHAIPCIINNCGRSVPHACGQYNGHFLFKYFGTRSAPNVSCSFGLYFELSIKLIKCLPGSQLDEEMPQDRRVQSYIQKQTLGGNERTKRLTRSEL